MSRQRGVPRGLAECSVGSGQLDVVERRVAKRAGPCRWAFAGQYHQPASFGGHRREGCELRVGVRREQPVGFVEVENGVLEDALAQRQAQQRLEVPSQQGLGVRDDHAPAGAQCELPAGVGIRAVQAQDEWARRVRDEAADPLRERSVGGKPVVDIRLELDEIDQPRINVGASDEEPEDVRVEAKEAREIARARRAPRVIGFPDDARARRRPCRVRSPRCARRCPGPSHSSSRTRSALGRLRVMSSWR